MTPIRALLAFLYDFVVGDDPTIAVAVVLALGVTAAIAAGGVSAWWVMPCAVIGALIGSLHRATRV
jgi:hydrogenase/urease accessory protein HupE